MKRTALLLFILCAGLLWQVSCVHAQESSPEKIMSFADHLYEQGDYYRAITEYERVIFFYPKHPLAPVPGRRDRAKGAVHARRDLLSKKRLRSGDQRAGHFPHLVSRRFPGGCSENKDGLVKSPAGRLAASGRRIPEAASRLPAAHTGRRTCGRIKKVSRTAEKVSCGGRRSFCPPAGSRTALYWQEERCRGFLPAERRFYLGNGAGLPP